MTEDVAWTIELTIKGGQADAARAMASELTAATQADEPGARQYQWYFNDAGTEAFLYERYADAAAAQTHLDNFGPKAERFGAIFEFGKVTILADLPTAMREALAGLSPQYRTLADGFIR